MKFTYTALSNDNQKLTGVLEAEDQNGAQEELHKMGVSIISISEVSDAEYEEIKKRETTDREKSGVITYTFLAVDKSGKEINGTIDARDPYSAFKRLSSEYGFKISELYPSDASDEEKADLKNQLPDFDLRARDEGINIDAKQKGSDDEMLEATEQIDKKIIEEIDHFIINTKKILSDFKDKFSPPFLRQIEATLGELERIRTSNNLKHITEVCNQIYELISNPDQTSDTDSIQKDPSYMQIVDSLQSTGIVRNQFSIHSKAVDLSKVKSVIDKVLKKLKLRADEKTELIDTIKKEDTGIRKFLNSVSNKFKSKNKTVKKEKPYEAKKPSLLRILFSYLSAPNPVLRRARKQELIRAFSEWRGKHSKIKEAEPTEVSKEIKSEKTKAEVLQPDDNKLEEVSEETEEITVDEETTQEDSTPKWKLSALFSELDSFIGWLLFFYIIYFFLVDFSIEKDIGIPRDFIIKTLKTPLILNITIFLLTAHLLFKLRDSFFRKNVFGSIFLFLFGIGLFSLIIINF
ncbi:hypothetical protein JW758_05810 [Candidatus Peregrinibacteria bacterium]|nr:hypothetical protein [Candidatus Peregrinibacteria bacterium]